MCRSRVRGGRRCPLHTPAAFVGTRTARTASGLDAHQVNAAFRVLRVEGERAQEPSQEEWAQWLQEQATEIESNTYHGRTMRTLREHISDAANDIPDGPTFYALKNLSARAKSQSEAVDTLVDRMASRTGLPRREVRANFNRLRREVDTSRDAPMPASYSGRVFRGARAAGLPLDTPTVAALGRLYEVIEAYDAGAESRIARHHRVRGNEVHSIGYDSADDGRLEVRLSNVDGSPSTVVLAYRGVPESVVSAIRSSDDADAAFGSLVRSNSSYAYNTPHEAEVDGQRRRCGDCGQFASLNHTCPQGASTSTRRAQPAPTDEQVTVVRRARRNRAEREVETAPISNDVSTYSLEHLNRDLANHPLEFEAAPVTGGLCAPNGGMAFGIEFEFSITSYSDIYGIANDLKEAGLTSSDGMNEYHAGRESGWQEWSLEQDTTVGGEIVSPILHDTPEAWEQIRTVCEIIKRNGGTVDDSTGSHIHISSDRLGQSTAKHAELVNAVNEYEDVIYRLGTEPGGIHRSTYWCAPNKDVDSVYINTMRPGARSLSVTEEFLRGHSNHSVGINLTDSANGAGSHVEFRQWDGTLNPAVLQARVITAASLVDHAARTEAAEPRRLTDLPQQRPRRRIGHHADLPAGQQHEGFLDFQSKIVSGDEQRSRVTSLYGATSWQSYLPSHDPAMDEEEMEFMEDDDNDFAMWRL